MSKSPDRLPQRQDCVARDLLERLAAEQPDAVFARFASDIADLTYGQLLADVRAFARKLRGCGVRQGDHVVVWLPTGKALLDAFLATNYLGAVYVPLNIAYRGALLEHAIQLSDAKVMVVHADLAERLNDVDMGALHTLVLLNGPTSYGGGVPAIPLEDVAEDDDLALTRPIEPWDSQAIIFTSGTTGPSKGVLVSYAQQYFSAMQQVAPLARSDRTLLHLPLFHVGGMGAVNRTLIHGGSVAVLEKFSTTNFWRDVRRTQPTRAVIMGSMASFLLSQPITDDERASTLRSITISPLTPDTLAFAKRIGVTWGTTFNMTETSIPIVSELNPEKIGMCGRPRAGIEARIVDENDCEVAPGEVGELILRSDLPWSMATCYYKNPEATARAWRNGWFHTGDGFRVDDDGDYQFVDRLKDAIRRRGENISSYEVEVEVALHPAVSDCAVVAAPSQHGEDEVLVALELRPGATLAPEDLLRFLQPRMPHYMLPRYVRIVTELPRTPTQRVQKHLIRSEGVTADTWDREAAGFQVSRETLRA